MGPRNHRTQPETTGIDLALERDIGSTTRRLFSLRALWVETPVEVRLLSAASGQRPARRIWLDRSTGNGQSRRGRGLGQILIPGDEGDFIVIQVEGSCEVNRVRASKAEARCSLAGGNR